MKIFKKYLFTIICFVILTINAQEYQSPKFGKGLFNLVGKDSTWSMKIAARMQFLSTSSWDIDGGNYSKAENSFSVRRARLKFNGFAYSPKLTYKIELGLSNRDIGGASKYTNNAPRYILDAVIKWNFYKNMTLWVGQTKLPGNRERVISSGNLQFVDRSLLNKGFNIDRDLGIQLRHYFKIYDNFIVKDMLSISQGEGRNITTGNIGGHQYTARVELLPLGSFKSKGDYSGGDLKREQTPKLALGITYNFNDNAVKDKGSQGSYMENNSTSGFFKTDISTVFIDMMMKYKGFSFMGEYAKRDAKNRIALQSDGVTPTGDIVKTGNSLNLQVGCLFRNDFEIAGRYTSVDFDVKSAVNQYTIGISKFIVGHKLKIQSDISYTNLDINKNNLLYRLQFDIHF